MRLTIAEILKKKEKKEKIVMLTAYDYTFAPIVDAAGVDIILVGDSMANVALGMASTTEISLDEMVNHSTAVVKGSKRAMVIGDMPYCAYQTNPDDAVESARRFIHEAGCQAVKLEWFEHALEVTEQIVRNNIPIMGHIGFTPQTADKLGDSKVQGKDLEGAQLLIRQAKSLEAAGCFSLVLECVPWQIAKVITDALAIPTIGIGAGVFCDGQVLVLNDMLGLFKRFTPKFVKIYEDMYGAALTGVQKYADEVRKEAFPSEKESFSMKEEEFQKLKNSL
ncbi:MAG: 3-methyl-2-oxobutanoate hydroxymethyltransferase [Spirochaetes bacterium RBG_16_49_21]|nr:MAG: 3-methyl-2-oxobutanoate hydroxymethyltransferase [Spirochaetes bacterium RBG_16_49_21]